MTLNIGIAQINPVSGDFKGNSKKIVEAVLQLSKSNPDIIVFPKYALTGYLPDNVVKRYPFLVEENIKWVEGLSKLTKNIAVVIWFIDNAQNSVNYSAAILKHGKLEKIIPNDEIYTVNGINTGISSSDNLIQSAMKLKNKGSDVFICCAAIPNRRNIDKMRNIVLESASAETHMPSIYVNQVGATDFISFDGSSMGVDANGKIYRLAKSFEEDYLVLNPIENTYCSIDSENLDFDNKLFTMDYESDLERTYNSLILGIRDYFNKCSIKRAVLGLSGGLDSSVCAVILADAIGANNVLGISMPSKLTSKESKTDAETLANNLGIHFVEKTIKLLVETATQNLEEIFNEVQINWEDRYKNSYTQDNIQARARAVYLFGISNEFPSCIPIATSDKSESYMGYATINGDMSGGFAPIADITKTKLFALARWLNKNRTKKNAIPESVILKKPGAELAINPITGETLKAEEALMPYEFMDEVIWRIENNHESYSKMLKSQFLYEKKFNITLDQKQEWLNKFFNKMSRALCKWGLLPTSVIIEPETINNYEYFQPITSCRINYIGTSSEEIDSFLNSLAS